MNTHLLGNITLPNGISLADDYMMTKDIVNRAGEHETRELGFLYTVKSVNQDIDSNIMDYEISYYQPNRGEMLSVTVPANVLSLGGISKLTTYGIYIKNSALHENLAYLETSAAMAPINLIASTPGWRKSADGRTFYVGSTSFPNEHGIHLIGTRFDLQPNGSFESVNNMIKEVAAFNVPLQTALSIGAAGLLVPLANSLGLMTSKALIISIAGSSSTGKSTAAALAASLFGSVNNSTGSLISNWAGTALSRTAKLSNVQGLSIVFDELGMATDSDVTSLIYQLSDGRSRERATQNGSLQEIQTWSLGFISTSEFSIYTKLQKAPGLHARILEFEDTKWTRSAQESDFIKDTINHNSGVVIPKLLDWIFNFSPFDDFLEQTKNLFKQYHASVTTQLGNIPMASRIAQQVALILVAADLLKSAFNWDFFDIKKIQDQIISDAKLTISQSPSEETWDSFLQWLLRNSTRFTNPAISSTNFAQRYAGHLATKGPLPKGASSFQLAILKSELEYVLNMVGTINIKSTLLDWEKSGYLVRKESDRMTTRVTVNKKRELYYLLNIDISFLEHFPKFKFTLMPHLTSQKVSGGYNYEN